jgi:hypothetical protein
MPTRHDHCSVSACAYRTLGWLKGDRDEDEEEAVKPEPEGDKC